MKSQPLRIVMFTALIIIFSGCATYTTYKTHYNASYDIGLSEVERPTNAKERYGEQKISKVQEQGIEKYNFEDEKEVTRRVRSCFLIFLLSHICSIPLPSFPHPSEQKT